MNLDLIQNKITNLGRIIDLQIIVFFDALKNHLCLNQQSWRSFSYILNTVLTGAPCIKWLLNCVLAK